MENNNTMAEIRKEEYTFMRKILIDAIMNKKWRNSSLLLHAIFVVAGIDRGDYDLCE